MRARRYRGEHGISVCRGPPRLHPHFVQVDMATPKLRRRRSGRALWLRLGTLRGSRGIWNTDTSASRFPEHGTFQGVADLLRRGRQTARTRAALH